MNLNDDLKLFYDFFQYLQQNIDNILNEEHQTLLGLQVVLLGMNNGKMSEWKSAKRVSEWKTAKWQKPPKNFDQIRDDICQANDFGPFKNAYMATFIDIIVSLSKNLMNKNNFIINTNQKIFTHMIT